MIDYLVSKLIHSQKYSIFCIKLRICMRLNKKMQTKNEDSKFVIYLSNKIFLMEPTNYKFIILIVSLYLKTVPLSYYGWQEMFCFGFRTLFQ